MPGTDTPTRTRPAPLARLYLALMTLGAKLIPEGAREEPEAGQSTETVLLILLGITVAGLVTAGVIAYINTKISLFK